MRLLLIFLISGGLWGQRVLYSEDLDKKGQDAVAAPKKLASEWVTSKELQNLSLVEKQEIDGVLKEGYATPAGHILRLSCINSRFTHIAEYYG